MAGSAVHGAFVLPWILLWVYCAGETLTLIKILFFWDFSGLFRPSSISEAEEVVEE
jgi:hypothetical protein